MPNFYIIAGCYGAGKTMASFQILPLILNCQEFVNADEIARGLSPFQPEQASIEAGKIMINRIKELFNQKVDFAIETTLSSKMYLKTIEEAESLGYEINILFFWLISPEMAVERGAKRVSQGGHHIPTETIFKRYKQGINYLFTLYSDKANHIMIMDNSYGNPEIIAQKTIVQNDYKIINDTKFQTLKSIAYE